MYSSILIYPKNSFGILESYFCESYLFLRIVQYKAKGHPASMDDEWFFADLLLN